MARGGENLTPEQMTQVQNAMNKVVTAGVETANVRTFKDMARRLYEMLRDTNRKLWEAMKRFLRNAWNHYGDLHEDLGLDEVSRAEATRIFDELEHEGSEPEETQRDTIETNNEQEAIDERTGLQPAAG